MTISISSTVKDKVGMSVTAITTASISSSSFPDSTNTGVPSGIVLTSSPSLHITSVGQVVSGLNINGSVQISANNVTLKNCKIVGGGFWVVSVDGGCSGVTIQDCEIDGQNGSADSLLYIGNTGTQGPTNGLQILRCNIHGGANGMSIGYGPLLFKDNYIHNLAGAAGSHINGIQYNGGANYVGTIDIEHNHIENANNNTDCLMIDAFYGPIKNVTINNNLLRGGGDYTVYCTNGTGSFTSSGIVVTNNVLNKTTPFAFDYFYSTGFAANTFSNNIAEETGNQIPHP